MLLTERIQQQVLFFSGKGGVGKTSLSAATAYAHYQRGKTVLLVSTDPAHNLGQLWEHQLGPDPRRILGDESHGLYGVEIDPAATSRAHVDSARRSLREVMPEHFYPDIERYLELAELSPGTREAALVERIADLIEQGLEYADLIIFDTAPSGHTAQLMALPQIMSQWVQTLLLQRSKAERFGAAVRAMDGDDDPAEPTGNQRIRQVLHQRQQRLLRLRNVLQDHQRCGFVVVLTPEKLPVMETVEFSKELGTLGIAVAQIIINRVTPHTQVEPLRTQRRAQQVHINTLRAELAATSAATSTAASARVSAAHTSAAGTSVAPGICAVEAQYPELDGVAGIAQLCSALENSEQL